MMLDATTWRHHPKIELHSHLDSSLNYHTVRQLSDDYRLKDFPGSFEAPPVCEDLADFLICLDPAISLMQDRRALRIAVDGMVDQMAADSVLYGEIRYAPLLHLGEGLSPEEVVETTLLAMHAASERYGVECGLLLCTLRHYSEEASLKTAALVERYANNGVVGLDLAADEAGCPIEPHVKAFERVRDLGLNATAHAGEAKGADSVQDTIEKLHVTRIGHGVRSIEDPSVVDLVCERGIHLEVCPTVNVQTQVFPSLADHPIDRLKRRGVSLGVNTDARGTSATSLTLEYAKVAETFGWTEADFLSANLEALNASFAPDHLKPKLKQKLIAGYST